MGFLGGQAEGVKKKERNKGENTDGLTGERMPAKPLELSTLALRR